MGSGTDVLSTDFWIMGMAIFGSILLYIPGNMAYIDALFFASGGCTQSGLNTIDINLLNTYQQILLFFFPMLCNPITINTFVVFLRLYWFEKRFQHIAKEAKRQRRSISKSRSQMRGERDIGQEEHGVNGRKITVMHGMHGAVTNGKQKANGEDMHGVDSHPSENQNDYAITFDKEDTQSLGPNGHPPTLRTQPTIKFADHVKRSDGMEDEQLRIPATRDAETHIAFLERQRNRNDGVLRIPGPRDADRGVAPETIDEEAPRSPSIYRRGSEPEYFPQGHEGLDKENGHLSPLPEDDSQHREVTVKDSLGRTENIAESAHAAVRALDALRFRKPRMKKKLHEDDKNLAKTGSRMPTFSTLRNHFTRDKEPMDPMPYISFQPTVGRNSAFVDLSQSQREELGGIEYRSLKSLALILVSYYWFWSVLGFICLVPWILRTGYYGAVVDAAGQNRTWWGFFTATSSFNDMGFTLTPDSMVSFQTAIFPLLFMSFLILIGNTAFPVMLRWIIWLASKIVPQGSGIWEELKFLLDHPRRCFTLLFPSHATWWLFWILVLLNGVDLLFFIILDFGNPIVTDLPPNIRVLDGWFQAASTRTAGFACVNLADLHPGIQISYLVMMYISVFPIAISVRRTNVYEEQSLGIWSTEEEDEKQTSYVGSHIRRQLSFDLWFVALGWFIIAISEGSRLQADNSSFTLFTVLFEIISAYGTVGLSLGYPGTNTSFSAQFGVIGKLVIIAMQIRGRHRGLPYELDRAILLPSESLQQREAEEAARRRRSSFATTSGAGEDLRAVPSNVSGREKEAGVATGAQRKPRSRSNVFSVILHPGPSMPSMHRRYSSRRKDSVGAAEDLAAVGESGIRGRTYHPQMEWAEEEGGREREGGREGSFGPPKKRMSA